MGRLAPSCSQSKERGKAGRSFRITRLADATIAVEMPYIRIRAQCGKATKLCRSMQDAPLG